jgi:hypothetical protein
MATRARIGIKQKSGRIIASYQHWDGYPGGLGYNLCENWENPKKVTDAIKLGDSSKWGVIIGEKHDFDADRHGSDFEHMNCYYNRDRGEKDVGYKIYKDEAEYIKNGFTSEGKEVIDDAFKPLERYAILEHIDILKRTMQMEDEAKNRQVA